MKFLTGAELLRVCHVNRRSHLDLLADDSDEWQWRSPADETTSLLAKARYFAQQSVFFTGVLDARDPLNERGGSIDIGSELELTKHTGSFTFDLWFALLPTTEEQSVSPGGVLLGAQAERVVTEMSHLHFHPIVYIDQESDLFCSVLEEQPVVLKKLELQRWYHVALTLERGDAQATMQCVYVDGQLVRRTTAALVNHWEQMDSMQVGTGRVVFDEWSPFCGVADEVRFWYGVLQCDQIRQLARGMEYESVQAVRDCFWSMRINQSKDAKGRVLNLRCAPPHERGFVQRSEPEVLCDESLHMAQLVAYCENLPDYHICGLASSSSLPR